MIATELIHCIDGFPEGTKVTVMNNEGQEQEIGAITYDYESNPPRIVLRLSIYGKKTSKV